MKIIITESQYKLIESYSEEEKKFKKLFFKIWQNELDSTGTIDFDPKIADYVNYNPQDRKEIYEMYRDFLGGWDKMIEKSYQLMDRTFDTMDYDFRGGYNFKFKPQFHSDYEEDNLIFVNGPIESDGKVTLIMTDGETHYLKDLEENEDLWWEIDSEIKSVIEDILYQEVTKKTGIIVDTNLCWIKE
jgi:hypothetical protein